MADAKLTALTAASALAAADLFYVSQSAASRKATGTQLLTLVGTTYVPLAGGTMTGALTIASGALTIESSGLICASALNSVGTAINYYDYGMRISSTGLVSWTSGNLNGTVDLALYQDAAATLAQRNGTTQQIFRLYNTADAGLANYERLTLTGVAGTSVNITAETLGTGGDNLDVVITPAGTGNVKFGTHSALAAETVTGYITIKDAGGTTRKLAVVS